MPKKINRFKKIVIIFLMVLLIVIPTSYFYIKNYYKRNAFLANLDGEIVFSRRDSGILNLYKISANGKNKRMLYHNKDPINSNSMNPIWSEDGSKIYFGAMKDGKWEIFSIDSDGKNPIIVQDKEWESFYKKWRLNEYPYYIENKNSTLDVKEGSLYYLNEEGKEILIYYFKNYNYKFNPGVSSPSWSPNKEFIIFQLCKFFGPCNILISNKDGTKVVKLTKGREPDWKE